MKRREFVGLGAVGALGAGVGLKLPAFPPTAGRSDRLDKIGIQLYSVRQDFARDPEGTLAQLAGIGYREVEFAGYAGKTPAAIKAMLANHGLEAPSAHIDLTAMEAHWDETLAAAREIGHRYLVLAWIGPEHRTSVAAYRKVAERLDRAATAAAAAGIAVGYHNHDFEFAPLEGTTGYDTLAQATKPDRVSLELDLFWATKGGRDPLALFQRYPGRFSMVHVKDMSAAGDMVDVGAGTIDFRAILRRRREAGIRHVFVEHDEPPDPMAFARRSYRYLADLTF
jgi:sugar phosphate isomerase/epimerase